MLEFGSKILKHTSGILGEIDTIEQTYGTVDAEGG